MAGKNLILSRAVTEKKMQRIALEIAEELYGEKDELIIVGIVGSGMVVAEKLSTLLQPLLSMPIHLITCQLNKKNPENITYSQEINFTDKNILLVDDVTSSGRTLMYALKPLLQFYPKRVQTMCLVERMHKNFPIQINFIGLSIATTLQEHIQVEVIEGELEGAYIL